jgi:ribosomal protein S24E
MDMRIVEDKKELLFSRRHVVAEIEFGEGKTPSRIEIRKTLANHVKADDKLTSIRKVETAYGFRKAKIEAYVYAKDEDMKKMEPKHIVKRHLPKEKKAE